MKPNDAVALLLRSPLHVLLSNTMLITVAGRKTDRPISTPVNYARCGNELWVLSLRSRKWWRNIQTETPVSLRLEGRDIRATADIVDRPRAVAAQLLEYVRLLPAAAGPLGLTSPTAASRNAERLAAERLFVRIRLRPPAAPNIRLAP